VERTPGQNERDLSRFEGEGGPSAPSGIPSSQPGTDRARGLSGDAAKLEACVPILRVRNARASTRYFLEVLGFQKDWEDPEKHGDPLLVSVSRDQVTFHLSERPEDGPVGGRANVHVDDARRLYEEFERQGARMSAPLEVEPDGSIEFQVRDLDDNVIRFDQIVVPKPPGGKASSTRPSLPAGSPPPARRRPKPS
jgi:hypothetical protein